MRQYEARYKIQAHIYECMTLMPDSEDHYETRQFKANTHKEAIDKAEELKWDVGKHYLQPKITLETLVHIQQERKTKEIKLK